MDKHILYKSIAQITGHTIAYTPKHGVSVPLLILHANDLDNDHKFSVRITDPSIMVKLYGKLHLLVGSLFYYSFGGFEDGSIPLHPQFEGLVDET